MTHRRCIKKALLKTAGCGPAQPEPRLEAGRCAHLALAEWMRGCSPEKCVQTFAAAYRPFADQFVPADDRLHYNNLEQVLEFFFASHVLAEMSFEVVDCEKQIEAQIKELQFNDVYYCLTDRSDGIVRQKADGSLWVLEWKSTSRIDDAFVASFKLDPQIYTHIKVAKANKYNVVGVIVGAIQFGKLPQRSRRKCRMHAVAQEDCWEAHHVSDFFFVQPPHVSISAWEEAMLDNFRDYRRSLLAYPGESAVHSPETGRYTRECYGCWASEFCYKGGTNLAELPMVPPSDPDVLRSGLYNDQHELLLNWRELLLNA